MFQINPKDLRGPVRAVHGVNLGPHDGRGMLDFTEEFRQWRIPSVRTHDANITGLDLVDLHCLFPNPRADPDDPANYSFELTDDYLQATRNTGAQIYFRLGESIEHQRQKKYVRPEHWPSARQIARVCTGILRHYNQGWANGYEWGIRDWEFWNEPELNYLKPPEFRDCWTGDARQFYDFYRATAPALKAADPSIRVGLASVTSHGLAIAPGEPGYIPDHPYRPVFEQAVADGIPIDFFSWHRYPQHWRQIEEAALTIRGFLDRLGLRHAESHMTEWCWMPRTPEGQTLFSARITKNYDQADKSVMMMDGAGSAGFIFGALARLQDLPVDMAHYYTGIASMSFGMFRYSGAKRPNAAGFDVFTRFLDGVRLGIEAEPNEDFAALAVRDGSRILVGLGHPQPTINTVAMKVTSHVPTNPKARQYTDAGWRDLTLIHEGAGRFQLPLAGPGITLLEWEDAT